MSGRTCVAVLVLGNAEMHRSPAHSLHHERQHTEIVVVGPAAETVAGFAVLVAGGVEVEVERDGCVDVTACPPRWGWCLHAGAGIVGPRSENPFQHTGQPWRRRKRERLGCGTVAMIVTTMIMRITNNGEGTLRRRRSSIPCLMQ